MSHVYTQPLPDEARAAILKEVCDYAESLGLVWQPWPGTKDGVFITPVPMQLYGAGSMTAYITPAGDVARRANGILTVEHPKSTMRFLDGVVRGQAQQLAETLE